MRKNNNKLYTIFLKLVPSYQFGEFIRMRNEVASDVKNSHAEKELKTMCMSDDGTHSFIKHALREHACEKIMRDVDLFIRFTSQ